MTKFNVHYDGKHHPIKNLYFRDGEIFVSIAGYANTPRVGDIDIDPSLNKGRDCTLKTI